MYSLVFLSQMSTLFQGSGCLPRVFNRGRSHQQSSGGSYSQSGRGGGGGGGGSGKSFLRRLGLPVGQGRGGNSSAGQRGGRGGRKFVENNKNAMMRSSTGGQHTGPLINMVKVRAIMLSFPFYCVANACGVGYGRLRHHSIDSFLHARLSFSNNCMLLKY